MWVDVFIIIPQHLVKVMLWEEALLHFLIYPCQVTFMIFNKISQYFSVIVLTVKGLLRIM